MNIENIIYTGIEYSYENKYTQRTTIKNMMKGKSVSLYVADYVDTDNTIDSGHLENPTILNNGKFYKITDIFSRLFEEHQEAILFYYKVNKLTVPTVITNELHKMFHASSKDLLAVLDNPKKKPLNEAKGDIDAKDFDLPEDEEEELDEDGNPKKKTKKKKKSDDDEPEVDEEDPEAEDSEEDPEATEDDEDPDDLNMDDFDVDVANEDEPAEEPVEGDEPNEDPVEGDEPENTEETPVEGDEPVEDTEDDSLNSDDFDTPDAEPDATDSETEPEGEAPTEDPAPAEEEPEAEDEDVVHNINILKLSAIERAMADSRIFESFKDLYQKAIVLKGSLNNYKTRMDTDILEDIEYKLNTTLELLKEYIEFKFGTNNFEENSKTFVLFSANINEIIKMISESLDE